MHLLFGLFRIFKTDPHYLLGTLVYYNSYSAVAAASAAASAAADDDTGIVLNIFCSLRYEIIISFLILAFNFCLSHCLSMR
jgi:hypothetical protein